jgi:hypothetical protein
MEYDMETINLFVGFAKQGIFECNYLFPKSLLLKLMRQNTRG